MHASELAQLAAIVALHAPVLIRSCEKLSDASLQQYWTASKCRLDHWTRWLKSHSKLMEGVAAPQRDQHWRAVLPVIEEILTSEALTRIWTAVACAYDRRRGVNDAEPVARSVMVGHLEARNRALTLMVFGQGVGAQHVVTLNRLRRRVERWTDMLLAYVLLEHDVIELAFDRDRAGDFADDLRQQRHWRTGEHAWGLILTSIKAAFPKTAGSLTLNAELNQQIADGVLACFGPELFDSTGLLKSLWEVRLTNVTDDAAGMIEELLSPELPVPGTAFSDRLLPRAGGFKGRF